MKIASSNMLLESTRNFIERDEAGENLRVWVDSGDRGSEKDRVTISKAAKSHLADANKRVDERIVDLPRSHQIMLEALLVESLSGREVKLLDTSTFQREADSADDLGAAAQESNRGPETSEGWGIAYRHESTHYESEGVSVAGAGIIQTADGKKIEFSLRLEMSREFTSHHHLNLRAGDAALMDPIVLNFDRKASELSDMKFSFDLDSDGVAEEVPMIRPGSGFLALDLNKDGIINDGKELFGPRTGEGFAELSSYDEDANEWIDENDPVYERLAVWSMDEGGNSSLRSLREREIGALYLGNLSSRFDLKGSGNELQGQITKTGVFLYENGTPGIIQELDLVV
jgi:hypothetical protein